MANKRRNNYSTQNCDIYLSVHAVLTHDLYRDVVCLRVYCLHVYCERQAGCRWFFLRVCVEERVAGFLLQAQCVFQLQTVSHTIRSLLASARDTYYVLHYPINTHPVYCFTSGSYVMHVCSYIASFPMYCQDR